MVLASISVCAGCGTDAARDESAADARNGLAVVSAVVDGDTIELADGRRVRLLQIDAPEPAEAECYSSEASGALRELLPVGTEIQLEADPGLDSEDRFGRALRYVHGGGTNVNLALVSRGAASPYFFRNDRGVYAAELLDAAREARAEGRGLWGACPGTKLEPVRALDAVGRSD
jgi:micrococcal nuclease